MHDAPRTTCVATEHGGAEAQERGVQARVRTAGAHGAGAAPLRSPPAADVHRIAVASEPAATFGGRLVAIRLIAGADTRDR